ncbi:MAG TPA: type I DNA topoisomerase [Candidatus Binatus sp.]|nr:type I DNA topoisomerase [Candidatus Binatus sp.]
MAKNLVIVESPAKAKTLGKYLGRNYQVKASIGHVMDLPKSKLGVDLENDFAAEYHVIPGKAKVLDEIKKAAKDKEHIYLAPDPDREGEAIAWHIAQKLGPRRRNIHRVLFNEITKKAVLEALKTPGKVDQNRFEAQQARRILDRLVGYKLSPLLWEKVRRGLSAGRVQSVAVRIICEREREIRAFTPEEYWTVEARLEAGDPPPFAARLAEIAGQKLDHKQLRLDAKARVDEVLARLRGVDWTITKVERKERRRHPTPPFITSRLQQEASRKLGFQPSRTMRIAQRLYEGVELGAEGSVGLITYMRTDSTRISGEAIGAAREWVNRRYGAQYVPESPNVYRSKKDAQDAHEAIRPTSMEYDPEGVARFLDKDEIALYTLIWNRFVASQMESAVYDATVVDIEAGECRFRANGQILKFDGFIRVYTEGRDDEQRDPEEEGEGQLPPLTEGEKLRLLELLPEQHFTQPPPRFTQATLIKELEEKGIGRPSTYASIMGTILNKEYVVEDEQRRLKPSELGFLVTDLLVGSFPDVLNVEFTAGMEDELDRIEEGEEHWVKTMRRFWEPFAKDLEKAEVHMRDVKREERPTGLTCEKCGQPMVIKWGRRGEFLACRGYPECKNTKNFTRDDDGTIRPAEPETTNEVCEKCGRPMQVRFGRYGKFLGCSGYPECSNMQPLHKPVPTGVKCLLGCGEGELMERRSRRGKLFYSCNRYPDCQFVAWDRPIPEPCPRCGTGFVTEKITKRYGTVRRCVKEECGWQKQIDTGDGGDYAPLPERRAAAKVRGRRPTATEERAPAGRRTPRRATSH